MPRDELLLLLVQANVAPEGEEDFNDWYNDHVPHLLKVPGYVWGQRYMALLGDRKYVALYQIESAAYFDSLLGSDHNKRHPITLSEWVNWDRLLISDARINVYEQISGTPLAAPLLRSDRPLSLVMADVAAEKEQEWNHWYDTLHLPNTLKVPGYVMGGRFRIVQNPAVDWLQMKPKYLAVYELENEEVVPSVMDEERMSPQAKAEFDNWKTYGQPICSNISLYAYRIISKHWPFEQPPH